MVSLEDHNVADIWLLRTDDFDENEVLQYQAILSRDELITLGGISHNIKYREYITTRAMVRMVLAKYMAAPPKSIEFSANSYGKPYIIYPECSRPLRFSVSHTEGLIVVAVAREVALGIDVEMKGRKPREGWELGGLFSFAEINRILAQPEDMQSECFLKYWTVKEAFSKAHGLGMAMPFSKVFVLPSNNIKNNITVKYNNREFSRTGEVALFDFFGDYFIAFAMATFFEKKTDSISCREISSLINMDFSFVEVKRVCL